jgi:hypothetical protein
MKELCPQLIDPILKTEMAIQDLQDELDNGEILNRPGAIASARARLGNLRRNLAAEKVRLAQCQSKNA